MGVSDGWSLIDGTETIVNVRDMGGMVVLEDGMILAVRAALAHADTFFSDKAGKYDLSVQHVVTCLLWWASKGVRPVCGLDGVRVPAKLHSHNKRDTRRARIQQRLDSTSLTERERESLMKQTLRVDTPYVVAIINGLRKAGVCIYRAPFEFDCQGAFLNRLGVNYAVVSADNDLIWYGAVRVIREVDRKTGILKMYAAENIIASGDDKWGQHVPFHQLVRVLGVQGAGVTVAMIDCDYNKVDGWTTRHLVKVLTSEKCMKQLKKCIKEGRIPKRDKDDMWGTPLQPEMLQQLMNDHKDTFTAHPRVEDTELEGMTTARVAYLHQIVSTPALVGDKLHISEMPLSQALRMGPIAVGSVGELPVAEAVLAVCGVPRPNDATVVLPADATTGCPAITTPAANAFNQGMIHDDVVTVLVPVVTTYMAGDDAPTHLVASMVKGGLMKTERVSEEAEKKGSRHVGSVDVAELHLFLYSRCAHHCSQCLVYARTAVHAPPQQLLAHRAACKAWSATVTVTRFSLPPPPWLLCQVLHGIHGG